MTFSNSKICLSVLGLVAGGWNASVMAANLAQPAACTVMGVVEGGGLYDWQDSDISLGGPQVAEKSDWQSGFAAGALGLSCSSWNFQADAAVNGAWASVTLAPPPTDISMRELRGHVGGAAFWRDPQSMALGVSGSWVGQNYDVTSSPTTLPFQLNDTGNLLRIGGFAEIYANDMLTFGASAHYFNGSLATGALTLGTGLDQFGFEFAGIAKIYPSNNLALTARFDGLRSQLRVQDTANFDFNGYALSLEGEYLFRDTSLSVFAGGRYADRTITFSGPATADIQDTQVYAGLKFAFGGAATSSIVARDRSSTYDNSSVFLEKLPSVVGSIDNTFLNFIASGGP